MLLCTACLASAAGYAWWSTVRRAALVSNVALPPIGSLSEFERSTLPSTETAAPPVDDRSNQTVVSETITTEEVLVAETPATTEVVVEIIDDDATTESEATANAKRLDPVPPLVLLRHTGLDASYGVMSVERSRPGEQRRATPLRCDRLHFAVDRGVCLTTDRFYTNHAVMVFDSTFQPLYSLPLNGVPSRVRLSPDGRLAAVTVFVSGHSYTDQGFSTETSIVDTRSGRHLVDNLEEFDVWRHGLPFVAVDFNFWGVTFTADGDRFYATLATGGEQYLVQGSVSKRRLEIVRPGVECPALSPDQTRIAFKKRVAAETGIRWRLHVLDLATREEIPLAETRHVDDQVEWSDDGSVLYALPDASAPIPNVTDVWRVAADGSGTPTLAFPKASSPTVIHGLR